MFVQLALGIRMIQAPMSSETPEDPMRELLARLPDDFARNLLIGSQRVIEDGGNPIRLHMFASTVSDVLRPQR